MRSFGRRLKSKGVQRPDCLRSSERTYRRTYIALGFDFRNYTYRYEKYHKISKMATEADTKSVIESGNFPDTDGERDSKRRVNLEAHLTAACGYGKKKQELVDSFWSIVWTGLAEQGWRKVRRITIFSPFHGPNFHQSIVGLMIVLLHLS